MKRNVFVLLVAVLLFVIPVSIIMAGGGNQTLSSSAQTGEITVAGVVFLEDQFMQLLSLGYQDAAKEENVKLLQGNSGNDQAKEAELINTYVTQKIQGLAITPISATTSVALLERAAQGGMKVAITNTPVAVPSIVGGYVSDFYELGASTGKAAAKLIKEKLNGKAKIVIIQHKVLGEEFSMKRANGFLDEVKKVNPNVEVIADQDAWMQDTAFQTVSNILTVNKDVNIVYGANDGATLGAVMAVKDAGLAGKCFVFGIDVGEQQIAMLKDKDNVLQAVTGQDPYNIGYMAMKTVIAAVKGKDVSTTQGKSIIIPGTLVSRSDPAGITKFEENLKARMGR
jgi:simple sugar transport system substrate-binding protein/ribose transport system substrate-binding protein